MIEKPIQNRYKNWEEIITGLSLNISTTDSMNHIVEQAIKKRNEADLTAQADELSRRKRVQEKDDFCKLIYSQYERSIYEPIREFVERFNTQYQGNQKMQISKTNSSHIDHLFHTTIKMSSQRTISIELDAVLYENYTRRVTVERLFPDERSGNEYYIPQCKNRDVLAWGGISADDNKGFNLLLLKNDKLLYGDWFIMENTNSGFSNRIRPEPFAFELNELPKEIRYIDMTHIYNSNLKAMDIQSLFEFISKYQ